MGKLYPWGGVRVPIANEGACRLNNLCPRTVVIIDHRHESLSISTRIFLARGNAYRSITLFFYGLATLRTPCKGTVNEKKSISSQRFCENEKLYIYKILLPGLI